MHGDASYIRHNSGTQQQQAPSLNSVFSKSLEDTVCGSVFSSICYVVECVVHPAHHTLPCLLLPRQDPSQPPRTAHALSNTGTGTQLELDTHGAGACCRRGGEVERSPAVHPEQLIVTQACDNPPLRCSLASQSETLALFHNQLYCSTLLYVNVWTTVK